MDLKAILLTLLSLLSLLKPLSEGKILPNSRFPLKEGVIKKQDLSVQKLTLESIFSSDHSWTEDLPDTRTISVITTGDVIPARTVNWKMTTYNDFTYPFLKTVQFLKAADLTFINLEAPLPKECPLTTEGMIFCGNQRFIQGLKFADIDLVNLANNHTLNYGIEGLCQTVELLTKNDISVSGLPQNLSCPSSPSSPSSPSLPSSLSPLAIKEIKGFKLGFLGFDILDQSGQPDQLLLSIQAAKSQVNFLIVSFHWGAEYQRFPAQETIDLAHQAIDGGADLVVGNHPHWYQPIEIYKEKLILYAHGNFIFDQEWSQETKTGIIGKYLIFEGKIVDAQFLPIFIHDYSQAYFLEGEKKEKIMENLQEISTTHSNNLLSKP